MREIVLSRMQKTAKNLIIFWFSSEYKEYFTLAGYAGTGKTTIINSCVEDLNLNNFQVAFCSFTGKAASVMSMKGLQATTVHKLIYDSVPVDEKVIDENGNVKTDNHGNAITRTIIRHKKKASLNPLIKLIIVDEVSMLPDDILKDLLSFGIKVLFIGDNGQLPSPAKQNNILDDPDFLLTEIHRQALDNPIIKLSMLAREGELIDKYGNLVGAEYGMFGEGVAIIHPDDVYADMLTNADQIIVGKNNTRNEVNQEMRELLGFSGDYPNVGEKVICTRNNWSKGITTVQDKRSLSLNLINGLIGEVSSTPSRRDDLLRTFRMDFKPYGFNGAFEDIIIDSRNFKKNGYTRSYNKKRREAFEKENGMVNQFDFGYAITCHKSQGSEFNKVLVYYEHFWKIQDQWLYTAITRAKVKLILVI